MAEPAPLWKKAADFAAREHRGQVRKDERTPYFAHPSRVALILSSLFGHGDETTLAAAYLHDLLEDCDVDYDEILEGFGQQVADLVAALSKDSRLVEPQREAAYDAQLEKAPWPARLIKLADVLDNLWDARTDESRRTLLDKARRAVRLAEADPQLARPREIVLETMRAVERELSSAGS